MSGHGQATKGMRSGQSLLRSGKVKVRSEQDYVRPCHGQMKSGHVMDR